MVDQIAPVPAPNQTMFHEKDKGKPSQEFATWMQSVNSRSLTALGNTRSAHTGPYTVLNSDKGATLALSGTGATSPVNTLTFTAASGYDANFQVLVLNEDTRGWAIAMSGQPTFILWPSQSCVVFAQNNVWYSLGAPRRYTAPSFNLNVDPVGSDNNDGLGTGAGAMQTILAAWNMIRDHTEGQANIQLKQGATFGPAGSLVGDLFGGYGRLIGIIGDTFLVNPPTINVPAGSVGIVLRDGAWAVVNGIRFVGGNGAVGVNLQQKSLCDFFDVIWGSFPFGFHIFVDDGADCNITGAEIITGGASTHWFVSAASKLIVGNIGVNGGNNAFAFPGGFLVGDFQARIQLLSGLGFSQCGFFTGAQYSLTRHSVALINPVVLPGSAGAVDGTSNAY